MARTKKGRVVSGWLVVDKPAGITSTAVVNKVKWAFEAQKAGHAGTLDPDSTGVLAVRHTALSLMSRPRPTTRPRPVSSSTSRSQANTRT